MKMHKMIKTLKTSGKFKQEVKRAAGSFSSLTYTKSDIFQQPQESPPAGCLKVCRFKTLSRCNAVFHMLKLPAWLHTED